MRIIVVKELNCDPQGRTCRGCALDVCRGGQCVPGHVQGRESILSKGDTTTLINLKSQQFVLKLLCDFFSVLEDALSQG